MSPLNSPLGFCVEAIPQWSASTLAENSQERACVAMAGHTLGPASEWEFFLRLIFAPAIRRVARSASSLSDLSRIVARLRDSEDR